MFVTNVNAKSLLAMLCKTVYNMLYTNINEGVKTTMVADKDHKLFLNSISDTIDLFIAYTVKDSVARRIVKYVYNYEAQSTSTIPLHLSNKELAKELNVSEATIKSSLSRAKNSRLITVIGLGACRLISLNTKTICEIRDSLFSL